MNKKIVAMVTSLAVGGSLLFAAGFANASQLSGYDALKAAIKDTKTLKSETVAAKLSVSDNGNSLFSVDSSMKLAAKAGAMSGTTTVTEGDKSQTMDRYLQDGKIITKNSNSSQYLVTEVGAEKVKMTEKTPNAAVTAGMESVVDALVGNMKDGVTAVENPDGTKTISVSLNANNITPLADAITQLAFARSSNIEAKAENSTDADKSNLRAVLPKLQSDIQIQSINATGNVNKDDIITSDNAKIVISGKDAQGVQHDIDINVDLSLSNINSTTPDRMDLTGKQIKTVDAGARKFDRVRL